MSNIVAHWIEAMRLRTLPVSLAGVVMASALAYGAGEFKAVPAVLCLLFALLAQIASNFANEYYDYRDGLDRPGREGPRRGVTEGDITPRAMLIATYTTLGVAGLIGLSLIHWGGWWLLPIGIVIALFAMAYSTGPYPLSRHGMGELTVLMFFGVIPVTLTYYVQALSITWTVGSVSLSLGLMGANVLIVNNYRDAEADRLVSKRTLAVILGPRATRTIYLLNGLAAMALFTPQWLAMPWWSLAVGVIYLLAHTTIWRALAKRKGHALTPMLGATAMLMFIFTILITLIIIWCHN